MNYSQIVAHPQGEENEVLNASISVVSDETLSQSTKQ